MVNACPMCLEDEENADHLLLRCRCAVKIWNIVISWFGGNWVLPRSIQHHFEAWKTLVGSLKGKERNCGSCRSFQLFGIYGRRGTLDALKGQKLK